MTEHESALRAIRDLDTLGMDKRKALALVKTIARASLRTACKALEHDK